MSETFKELVDLMEQLSPIQRAVITNAMTAAIQRAIHTTEMVITQMQFMLVDKMLDEDMDRMLDEYDGENWKRK